MYKSNYIANLQGIDSRQQPLDILVLLGSSPKVKNHYQAVQQIHPLGY